jgi:pyruvate dehydrogenase E1 component alpha subunit
MMVLIRRFEEMTATLCERGEIRCPAHLAIGQEACAAGVCAALRPDDYVLGAHRSHGHFLAKGGDPKSLMAEMLGKAAGCSRGRGGSMHLLEPSIGFLGTVPIVAATVPIAVGVALAIRLRNEDRIAVSFFGDGAMEEGTTHEAMNFAAHRRLPVVFACENNFYSSHMSLLERRARDNLCEVAQAHGLSARQVDGNDVLAVYETATAAAEYARAGRGPAFLELRTFRWRGHVGPAWDYDVGVRRRDELAEWIRKDPIERIRSALRAHGWTSDAFDRVEREVARIVEDAVAFARAAPAPDPGEVTDHVYAEPR